LYAFRIAGTDKRRATAALEAALVVDPGFVPALEKLGSLALQSERPLSAKTALSRALAKDPSYDPARISLASTLLAEPLGAYEARALLAERPQGDAGPALEATLARVVFDLGDRQRGATLGEQALGRLFKSRSLRGLLIKAALDRADPAAALALVEDAIKLEPGRLAHRLARARILSASGDTAGLRAALGVLQADAQTFVDAPAIPRLAAELALRQGDVPQAIAALDRVALLSPEDREARRHRASLKGESGELEDEYSVDPLSYLGQPPSPAEQAWGASVLLERTAVRLYENGTSSRFVQRVTRLAKASLGDLVRRDQIAFSPSRENVEILSAEQIHPDGEVLKASRISEDGPRGKVGGQYIDARSKQIEFDDVRPGDLLNLRYRVDSVGPNIFGGFFGDMNVIEGQLPKERVEVIALAPADRPLFPGVIRAPAPELSIEGGVSKMIWRRTDVPALEPEPLSPPYTELGTTVSVSTYQSWDELAAWYAQLFRDQMELDDDSREAGRRAVAGATSGREDPAPLQLRGEEHPPSASSSASWVEAVQGVRGASAALRRLQGQGDAPRRAAPGQRHRGHDRARTNLRPRRLPGRPRQHVGLQSRDHLCAERRALPRRHRRVLGQRRAPLYGSRGLRPDRLAGWALSPRLSPRGHRRREHEPLQLSGRDHPRGRPAARG
jgi:tetratricopeptide (TPR) repeat protein